MENIRNNEWIKGPILNLVISPVVALLLTHFYELGFAIYFGIHPKFITISLSTVYYLCLILFGFAIFYLLIRFVIMQIIKNKIYNIITRIENKPLGIIVILMLLSISGAFFWGYKKAMDQKLYLIRKTTPEQVVLRIYGDKLITVPYDKQNKEVRYGQYYITKIGDEPYISIEYDVVGPLSPVKY
jgi:hypothetical protein